MNANARDGTREILLRAADIVDAGWCQHTMALDADGGEVTSFDDNAARFCVIGSIRRARLDTMLESDDCYPEEALLELLEVTDWDNLAEWNDEPVRTGAEVSAALRECAETV